MQQTTKSRSKPDRTVPQEMFILEVQVVKPSEACPEGRWQGIALSPTEPLP